MTQIPKISSKKGMLLLDLDGTLLVNPVDPFLKAYFSSVIAQFQDVANPDVIEQAMMTGTKAMIENRYPDRTLDQIFFEIFTALTNLNEVVARKRFETIFFDKFHQFKSITTPMEGVPEFIKVAGNDGYMLVIATNPLFPEPAIKHRLDWAGIGDNFAARIGTAYKDGNFPFEMITSIETFHYAKPSPAYFMEIIARHGYPVLPVTVIGDDFQRDIIPAKKLGLNTFWTPFGANDPEPGIDLITHHNEADGVGTLENAWSWLGTNPKAQIPPAYVTLDACIATLQTSPTPLEAILASVTGGAWILRPNMKEWSLIEIICHLRDVDRDINIPRFHDFINKDNPTITGIDSDSWADKRNYQQEDPFQAVRDFTATRIELLNLLDQLDEHDWQKPAWHTIFGKTNFSELMQITAEHDRLHIRQLFSTRNIVQDSQEQ